MFVHCGGERVLIKIEPRHFEYLRVQKGSLDALSHDPQAWKEAYEVTLELDYESIKRWIPPRVERVLDIGGGLGGIDVLINRNNGPTYVAILDGEDDKPEMKLHRQTFNSRAVTIDFLEKNGVNYHEYRNPFERTVPPYKFDLVISLGSWCFHYAPENYLSFVVAVMKPQGRLIVDVRVNKPAYLEQLSKHFRRLGTAKRAMKYNREVFELK